MLLDIGSNITLDVNEQRLVNDIKLAFRNVKETNQNMFSIKCEYSTNSTVLIKINEIDFEFQYTNWIANLFQLMVKAYLHVYDNCILLHGSCLLCKNKVVILLGHSRSGKSTALFNLLKLPTSIYVSDEVVAIDPIQKVLYNLSARPIQIRYNDSIKNDYSWFDDAWNMSKITYYQPKHSISANLDLRDYLILYIFINYEPNTETSIFHLNESSFINYIVQSCFNISQLSKSIDKLTKLDHKTLSIKYSGDINEIWKHI